MYIELHAASAFSFLQGASLPETLVARAAALGYPALALLDADGVYGIPRFHKAAQRAGLRAIIGVELTIAGSGVPLTGDRAGAGTGYWRLPVLVQHQTGYQHLCRLVTTMKMRAAKGEGALRIEELEGFTSGLIALAGRPLLDARRHGVGGLLDRLVGLFGRQNTYVELQRHGLRDDEGDNATLTALAEAFRLPVVATNGVRFAAPTDRPLFDTLTCVRHHTTLDAAGRRLARNAERYLKSPEAMGRLFADRPEALAGAAALAERLEYTMADLGYRFPVYPVAPGDTEMSFLRHITEAGARERYRPYHEKARAQITRELDLIEKLDLAGYFLIVWDIVNFCRQHDILAQGRGSAANSAVCYSLGITAVDPIAMDLLFERFLSEERGEWPDIDLDLPSGDRRERVIQHVYEKYGARGAAMTANVITYRGRSAAREVGKVLSLDAGQVDRLAKVMNHFEFADPRDTLDRNLAAAGVSPDAPRVRTFAELWLAIQDLPRHLGQHSGGMVICQGALDAVVPLEPATMPGRVVIQWDKDDCADLGIVKVDLLGLGMMAVLQDAIVMVNDTGHAGPSLDLAQIPQDDPAVYALLQEADTVGVFQVESRAQMATLPRLKPTRFYDLVVEVAIIRPGPIVGQMVHPYLNRRAGREPVVPLHPSLEPILARTLGVPLFQEQLLRMAMVAAGFTGGQAEELRRAMGFKRSARRMQQLETQLRDGMAGNGITGETADRIITSITSFALYGFPESHAASFALIAYASAWLKVHYPAAFYTALLNNQPMGFYHPATLVKDAQRRGVRFHPIDVQQSDWLCTVAADGGIRLGLMYVRGLRGEAAQALVAIEKRRRPPARTEQARTEEARAEEAEVAGARTGARTGGRVEDARAEGMTMPVGDDGRRPLRKETLQTDRLRTDTMPTDALRTNTLPTKPPCTKCGSEDDSMIEAVRGTETACTYFCNTCAHEWTVAWPPAGRFGSIEEVVQRTGLRRDELTTLADVGALNAFTGERRSALWQVERAVRPAGALFEQSGVAAAAETEEEGASGDIRYGGGWNTSAGNDRDSVRNAAWNEGAGNAGLRNPGTWNQDAGKVDGRNDGARASEVTGLEESGVTQAGPASPAAVRGRPGGAPASTVETGDVDRRGPSTPPGRSGPIPSPLRPMTDSDRLRADYGGMGLTIGPHPMALRRHDLALRGVSRATDLLLTRDGRRVRVAGMVITRQRPGTAKGFVFLTLEDETGVSNVIIRPDLFDRERLTVVGQPFLLVEGVLQNQDGVRSVRAERLQGIAGAAAVDAHDFY